jgi:hypothetical protein
MLDSGCSMLDEIRYPASILFGTTVAVAVTGAQTPRKIPKNVLKS